MKALLALTLATFAVTGHAAAKKVPFGVPANGWPAEKLERHALNRLAFGPSPRDLEQIHAMGVAPWIVAQLHPNQLDDAELSAKLEKYPTLKLTTAELYDQFPPPKERAKELGLDLKQASAKAELAMMIPKDELPRHIAIELVSARLLRAVESRRQLQEVLLDFWFNHFNVSADKGAVRYLITSYERDALRPHLFGKFRDLLGSVAHHPAMLFYLDNWTSTRDGFEVSAFKRAKQPGFGKKFGKELGLNENYARELLELHTLGVDGGYTQDDVRTVARAFTGWSIDKPQKSGEFLFRPLAHDSDEKTILGKTFPSGQGIEDGEQVLDLLARHPATAHHLAKKLCQKFVSDDPPAALVDRVAKVFLDTDGDLTATYEAIFASREFWSDDAYESKTKKPLELAVSAIRALNGTTDGDIALAQNLDRMGERLYRAQPPTGYAETAETWVNAGALVNRINFGLALVSGRVKGTTVTLPLRASDAKDSVDVISQRILGRPLQKSTREVVLAALANDAKEVDGEQRSPDTARIAGLLLGSPDFQKQ